MSVRGVGIKDVAEIEKVSICKKTAKRYQAKSSKLCFESVL
jgi:hypothetical protein